MASCCYVMFKWKEKGGAKPGALAKVGGLVPEGNSFGRMSQPEQLNDT